MGASIPGIVLPAALAAPSARPLFLSPSRLRCQRQLLGVGVPGAHPLLAPGGGPGPGVVLHPAARGGPRPGQQRQPQPRLGSLQRLRGEEEEDEGGRQGERTGGAGAAPGAAAWAPCPAGSGAGGWGGWKDPAVCWGSWPRGPPWSPCRAHTACAHLPRHPPVATALNLFSFLFPVRRHRARGQNQHGGKAPPAPGGRGSGGSGGLCLGPLLQPRAAGGGQAPRGAGRQGREPQLGGGQVVRKGLLFLSIKVFL